MNSLDILHTVNVVAVATSNLRFCYTVPELAEAYNIVRYHLESIRLSVSRELYTSLEKVLRDTLLEQSLKIKEYEA